MIEPTDETTEIVAPELDVQETPQIEETVEPASDDSLESKVAALADADAPPEDALEPTPGEKAEPAEAAFEPNFKFKVLEEEHEIDEMFRPLINSKEAEDKIRELHEKAYGIDHIKQDRDRFREDFTAHREALEKQTSSINTLSGYLDEKDYESFFQALEIPKAEILRFALTEAQKESWTPEQRQQYDDQWQAKRRANLYQEQYNTNQTQLESLRQEQVVKDYTLELYKPEVREFETAFDQRNGKDAFRTEVAQLGTYHEKVDGVVKPVGELVNSVMQKFGAFMQANNPAAQQAAQTQKVSARDVPVIPNTGPAGQAPTQRAIKSLADLEKYADSL